MPSGAGGGYTNYQVSKNIYISYRFLMVYLILSNAVINAHGDSGILSSFTLSIRMLKKGVYK